MVVIEDTGEGSPARGSAYDLRSGESTLLNGQAGLPEPAEDGEWSLNGNRFAYPHIPGRRSICVVRADLATMRGETVGCVRGNYGLNEPMVTPFGLAWTQFDDRRPNSCATPILLPEGGRPHPVEAADPCKAWDVAVAGPAASVWSQVIRFRAISASKLFAQEADELLALGPIVTGSLIWCGDYAYWSTGAGDIRRWKPGDETVTRLYEKEPGQLKLSTAPICGGDTVAFDTIDGTASTPGSELDEVVLAATVE